MSTIISPSFKWIVYIGHKIWHSLNPMICVITEKGQLLPLSLTMYAKIATSKCHISWLIYAILLKFGEVT